MNEKSKMRMVPSAIPAYMTTELIGRQFVTIITELQVAGNAEVANSLKFMGSVR